MISFWFSMIAGLKRGFDFFELLWYIDLAKPKGGAPGSGLLS